MLGHGVAQALERRVLSLGEARQRLGLRFTQGVGLLAGLVRAVAQGVGQALLHGGQLHTEAVELFVLGACGVALLGQQGLLQQPDRLRHALPQLLAGATGAALQLVAHFALHLGQRGVG